LFNGSIDINKKSGANTLLVTIFVN